MKPLQFSVTINAPKQKVWDTMLGDATCRQWTTPFCEGSYFEGSWETGSKILFLAPSDGKTSGMVSRIAENQPYEFVSIEHLGEVVDGVEDTTSERVKQWAGMHENYTFSEESGQTTVLVEMDSLAGDSKEATEMNQMFADIWPKALAKLKEIAEE